MKFRFLCVVVVVVAVQRDMVFRSVFVLSLWFLGVGTRRLMDSEVRELVDVDDAEEAWPSFSEFLSRGTNFFFSSFLTEGPWLVPIELLLPQLMLAAVWFSERLDLFCCSVMLERFCFVMPPWPLLGEVDEYFFSKLDLSFWMEDGERPWVASLVLAKGLVTTDDLLRALPQPPVSGVVGVAGERTGCWFSWSFVGVNFGIRCVLRSKTRESWVWWMIFGVGWLSVWC